MSVVGGEWQGSDAHIARGEGAAFDVAVPTGVVTRCVFPWGEPERWQWYGLAATPCGGQFDYWGTEPESGDEWHVRYCHLSGRVGLWPTTGNTGQSTGPHLHVKLWCNGDEVRFEDLPWSRSIK